MKKLGILFTLLTAVGIMFSFAFIGPPFIGKNPPPPSIKEIKDTVHTSEVLEAFENADTNNSFPTIMVKNEQGVSSPLRLDQLAIDIKIVGNIARTTLDLTFLNELGRVLEGELYIPLAEGQVMTRFALDINGKLREGVIVEKEKGRKTFEAVIRKQIDPGLLEWSAGNNFKARIYPIPAGGTKRCVVAFEQELSAIDKHYIYHLPMKYKSKLTSFNVSAEVFNHSKKPVNKDFGSGKMVFSKKSNGFSSSLIKTNIVANKDILIAIPQTDKKAQVYIETNSSGEKFFLVNLSPEKRTKKKDLPKTVTVVWDVSNSAQGKNLEKEFELLNGYFSKFKKVEVELITFSNVIHSKSTIQIKGGSAAELISRIKSLTYDGGTQIGCLNPSTFKGEEIILSTDGLSNFGNDEFSKSPKPIYPVNSSSTADHSRLNYIAYSSNGEYINLASGSVKSGLKKISEVPFKFLGIEKNTMVGNTSPTLPTSYESSFSIAGRLESNTSLKLKFGFGNKVEYVEEVRLEANANPSTSGLVERIWAQKRISELDLQYQRNKNQITDLGKKYGIVTRNTSLIVLDRIEDYVQHRITPPTELLKEYQQRISTIESEEKKAFDAHIETVISQYKNRIDWWNKTFKIPEKIELVKDKKDLAGGANYSWGDGEAVEEAEEEAMTEDEMEFGAFADEDDDWGDDGTEDPAAERPSSNRSRPEAKEKAKGGRKGSIALKSWNPDTPYLKALNTSKDAYRTYLVKKKEYGDQPSFFLDVADFFLQKKDTANALRILSNIAELELENHRLLRILGHRLEQLKQLKLAISVFEDVKEIRGEEPQSYRDLATVYAADKQYQKAVDNYYHVVSNSWDGRFPGIEALVCSEMNATIAKSGTSLDLSRIHKDLLTNLPSDMRVVLNWDTDNSDMDLWVIDPLGEKCYYSHKETVTGGRMSEDYTGGYGPEEFVIKKAVPGKYVVKINYYGSSQQTITGPTTIQIDLVTNYGRNSQKIQQVTRRLGQDKEIIEIGSFSFE